VEVIEQMEHTKSQPLFGSINVPLAIFWSEPGNPLYENISLKAATYPAKWSKSLDTDNRLWLVDKVNTSAIFGERVVVLDQQDDWYLVAAANQRTQGNAWGQVGWIPADQICFNDSYLKAELNRPAVIMFVPRGLLFRDAYLSQPLVSLSYMVSLPLLAESDLVVEVCLPNGYTGFISRDEVTRAADLCFSRSNIVEQAKQFLGLRYIWAGTSAYGFDCSGFTFRLYQSQGVSIPRNSISQSQEGIAVGKASLLPGDLMFFASEGGKGNIHHVSMYSGNGTMIHAPASKSAVKETCIDAEPYRLEFWGARRYCAP